MRPLTLLSLVFLAAAGPAFGEEMAGMAMEGAQGQGAEATAGDIVVTAARARAMLPGQPAGGGYLTVTNNGSQADRLVAVSSPSAGRVEIHSMSMSGDVMVMRPVEGGLEIPAGGTVELKPGGFHLMFMAVSKPFAAGGAVPVTLEFARAGKLALELPVRPASGN